MIIPFRIGLKSLVLAAFTCLGSCRQAPEVQEFDSKAWKADPKGCKGNRAAIWNSFLPDKSNLLGYDENNLSALLGPADKKNLLEKGQKTYSYYIAGAPECQPGQRAKLVQVRVNVTGKVSEVNLVTQ